MPQGQGIGTPYEESPTESFDEAITKEANSKEEEVQEGSTDEEAAQTCRSASRLVIEFPYRFHLRCRYGLSQPRNLWHNLVVLYGSLASVYLFLRPSFGSKEASCQM